ncbi:hypothetical protein Tco_1089651 [Tanacetum coccineum]
MENGTRNVVPTDAPANVVPFSAVLHFADVAALFENGTTAPSTLRTQLENTRIVKELELDSNSKSCLVEKLMELECIHIPYTK